MPDQKLTMDYLRSEKKPQLRTVWIPTDHDLADEYEMAEAVLADAKTRYQIMPSEASLEQLRLLEDEFDELRKKIRKPDHSLKFVFQSIGPKRYDKLVDEHPVTETQKEDMKSKGLDPDSLLFEVDTFAPALVAASCIEPKMDLEYVITEIQKCEDGTWSSGEFNMLYSAAIEVNVRTRNLNLGKDFKRMPSSKKS